jgi:hypothetical protein
MSLPPQLVFPALYHTPQTETAKNATGIIQLLA